MRVDRRTLLKTGAAAAAATALPNGFAGSTASAAREAKSFAEYLSDLGYELIPPANLITGHSFNGGVSYDEGHDYHGGGASGEPSKWFVLQDCARLDDIAKRNEFGVLAYFHILGCTNNAPAHRGEVLEQIVKYLVGPAGLKPERFVLVATERGDGFLEQLEPFGFKRDQVVLRKLDDARTAGDGSGYFKPDGHPMGQEFHTLSFHYAPEGKDLPSGRTYPLPGYLEIGEFLFEPQHKAAKDHESFGLGAERLVMAQGKLAGDFNSSRERLLAKLRDDTKRNGLKLPNAYDNFSAL
ncbi:MAG: twin-arginine translocation signal domain-containing protein [Hyphomicrobiaceae bacterium]|nr:twin-arginine translocation signal domain-containing protein [Hyphomicrobiaceae bacterium]